MSSHVESCKGWKQQCLQYYFKKCACAPWMVLPLTITLLTLHPIKCVYSYNSHHIFFHPLQMFVCSSLIYTLLTLQPPNPPTKSVHTVSKDKSSSTFGKGEVPALHAGLRAFIRREAYSHVGTPLTWGEIKEKTLKVSSTCTLTHSLDCNSNPTSIPTSPINSSTSYKLRTCIVSYRI
jgi:hypothetical protein